MKDGYLRFRLRPVRSHSRQRVRRAPRLSARKLPVPSLLSIPYRPFWELAGFDWPTFHKAGIRLAMELKALVGRRGVVIYNGGPHDRSWPLQLDLLIDWPPA